MKQDYNKAFELAKDQIVNVDEYNKAKASHQIYYKCATCNLVHSVVKKLFVKAINNNPSHKKYCSNKCYIKYLRVVPRKYLNCLHCNGLLEGKYKTKFCSHRCSALHSNKHRIFSEESKKKTSLKLKQIMDDKFKSIYKNEITLGLRDKKTKKKLHDIECVVCKTTFKHIKRETKTCSKKCFLERSRETGQVGGLVTASLPFHKRNRSKNERLFFDLIEKKFDDALSNPRMFNGFDADIVIPCLSVAIHWNGAWHYRQVFPGEKGKRQFEQVKLRDKLRMEEVEKYGYKNYVIKDMKQLDEKLVQSEYEKFVNGWPTGS